MSDLEDEYDQQEPEIDMHFFDADDGPKIDEASASSGEASDNENELSPILLDTSLDPFVPLEADQYARKRLLRFSRDQLPPN